MRAIQIAQPRKIAMLDTAPKPEPEEGEVLVQCSHIGLCGSNMGQYTGEGHWATSIEYPNPIGWAGHENLGTIVDSRCEGWEPGMKVLAQPKGYAGFAEYIVSSPDAMAVFPAGIENPASLVIAQPLATVLRAMTMTINVTGLRCAVIGQGPMGLIFTQLLPLLGAREVIATDLYDTRLEWAKKYGAAHVINASRENVVESVRDITGGEMVDFVVEAVGKIDSLHTSALLAKPYGRLFVFGMPHYEPQEFPWYQVFRNNVQINTCVGPECGAFFQQAMDMVLDNRCSSLRDMVQPLLPWDKAAEGFEVYDECARGSLKLTFEL